MFDMYTGLENYSNRNLHVVIVHSQAYGNFSLFQQKILLLYIFFTMKVFIHVQVH